MKKPKLTVEENFKILDKWKEIEEFRLAHMVLDETGKPAPNPLVDALYIAGTHAAKALQQ